jgi:hypothetical protein
MSDEFVGVRAAGKFISLAFDLPQLRPPNMIPCVEESVVQSEFSLKQIDAPLPEAPFERKCQHQRIQFHTSVAKVTTAKFFQEQSKSKQTSVRDSTPDQSDLNITNRIMRENVASSKQRDSSLASESELLID